MSQMPATGALTIDLKASVGFGLGANRAAVDMVQRASIGFVAIGLGSLMT